MSMSKGKKTAIFYLTFSHLLPHSKITFEGCRCFDGLIYRDGCDRTSRPGYRINEFKDKIKGKVTEVIICVASHGRYDRTCDVGYFSYTDTNGKNQLYSTTSILNAFHKADGFKKISIVIHACCADLPSDRRKFEKITCDLDYMSIVFTASPGKLSWGSPTRGGLLYGHFFDEMKRRRKVHENNGFGYTQFQTTLKEAMLKYDKEVAHRKTESVVWGNSNFRSVYGYLFENSKKKVAVITKMIEVNDRAVNHKYDPEYSERHDHLNKNFVLAMFGTFGSTESGAKFELLLKTWQLYLLDPEMVNINNFKKYFKDPNISTKDPKSWDIKNVSLQLQVGQKFDKELYDLRHRI